MSQKKKKSAGYSGGKDPALLQDDGRDKKMDPLARRMLFGAVVLVGAAQVLDTGLNVISRGLGDVITLGGLVLLIAALAVQSRSAISYRDRGPGGKNRRL